MAKFIEVELENETSITINIDNISFIEADAKAPEEKTYIHTIQGQHHWFKCKMPYAELSSWLLNITNN